MPLHWYLRRTMPVIDEKLLHFDFPDWEVVQYDENGGFYRNSVAKYAQHVAGMDIVCRPPGARRLVLIEAKDFRTETDLKQTLNGSLREVVLRKTLSTLAGLFVAERAEDEKLRPLAILTRQLPIEVVLFMVERAVPPTLQYSPTALKLRKSTTLTGRNDLEQTLTAQLLEWGIGFQLRGTPGPLALPTVAADGWSVRIDALPPLTPPQ